MKVVVRVRPESDCEENQRTVVRVVDGQMLTFDPKEVDEDFYYQGVKLNGRDFNKKLNKNITMNFDYVFDGNASNEDVHENTTKLVLDGLLDGYNCSVFAYGATGSGKTHTMLGNVESPGITFLTVMELFERLESMKEEKTIEIAVSYLEVYNENIKDLLAPKGVLQIREDSRRGVIVPGLTIYKPRAAGELLDILHKGNKNRTQHPTDANAESSRSHAVFTVYVKQQDRKLGSLSNQVRVAKLALIDLAGSERATVVSGGNACRQREGANINKSLLALGNCINALADRKPKGHVPYRNSKLTRILKDSLDGNCFTVMIAAVSPSVRSYDDSYNTLKYAARAKNIKTNLKQNIVNVDVSVGQYAKVVKDLRLEIAALKKQLEDKPIKMAVDQETAAVEPIVRVQSSLLNVEETKLKSTMKELFAEGLLLNKQYADVSRQMLELDMRVAKRQNCIERLKAISVDSSYMCRSATKMDNAVSKMTNRKERLLGRKVALEKRLDENKMALSTIKEQSTVLQSKVLLEWLNACHMEVDVKIQSYKAEHAARVAQIENEENGRMNKLISEVLKVVQRQYLLLKVNNLATSDVDEDFNAIVKQVEGFKEVAWVDQVSNDDSESVQFKIDEVLSLPISMKSTSSVSVETHSRSKPLLTKEISEKTLPVTEKSASFQPKLPVGRSLCLTSARKSPIVACDSTFNMSPVPFDAAASGLDSTFVKPDVTTSCAGRTPPAVILIPDSTLLRSGRRLTFETPGPSSILVNIQKENQGSPFVLDGTPLKEANEKKRTLLNTASNSLQKKLKTSSSMSNLSNIMHLKRLGYPSMFDRSKKIPQTGDSEGSQNDSASRLNGLKIRPTKNRTDVKSHPYLSNSFVKRTTSSSNVNLPPLNYLRTQPKIEPKSTLLSRMRGKSVVNLKSS